MIWLIALIIVLVWDITILVARVRKLETQLKILTTATDTTTVSPKVGRGLHKWKHHD